LSTIGRYEADTEFYCYQMLRSFISLCFLKQRPFLVSRNFIVQFAALFFAFTPAILFCQNYVFI